MIDYKTYLDNVINDPSVFYGEVKPSFIIEFQERCYVITCEKLRDDLTSLGITEGIYIDIITEESKNIPYSPEENRVFLFCENKPRKNSVVARTIEGIVKKVFPDKTFNLAGRRGLNSLVRPPDMSHFIIGNRDEIINVLKNIDETSKELYVKLIAVLKNGKKSILEKYISPSFKMYNELVIPGKADIVVSGGVYNTLEVNRIYSQIGPNGRIIGFEPNKTKYKDLKDSRFKNLKINPSALGNVPKGTSYFEENAEKSKINKNGKTEVRLTTIDSELKGSECDMIKLNINGYELEALEGAKATIKKYKPKLQILLDPRNILAIPKLLISYNKDYTFYIGYYDKFNNLNNIILYAI